MLRGGSAAGYGGGAGGPHARMVACLFSVGRPGGWVRGVWWGVGGALLLRRWARTMFDGVECVLEVHFGRRRRCSRRRQSLSGFALSARPPAASALAGHALSPSQPAAGQIPQVNNPPSPKIAKHANATRPNAECRRCGAPGSSNFTVDTRAKVELIVPEPCIALYTCRAATREGGTSASKSLRRL